LHFAFLLLVTSRQTSCRFHEIQGEC
jgi:hypothetical protein